LQPLGEDHNFLVGSAINYVFSGILDMYLYLRKIAWVSDVAPELLTFEMAIFQSLLSRLVHTMH